MLHYEQLCGENCFKTDIDFAIINTMYNFAGDSEAACRSLHQQCEESPGNKIGRASCRERV